MSEHVDDRRGGDEDGPAAPSYADLVLDLVDRIPPGRVMTYGDVAEYLGAGGPRQVGRVMATSGGAVAWWRVVRADGRLLPGHERRALAEYSREGTPLRGEDRVDLRGARWHGPLPEGG
ncbi:MGMT family protein [Actinocorallia sp. A-T 12471]|uniref:MGMT family protein n=1 Tax=Actinocorallia sp. A-T 12471 TaxID=3089813 RepID=UPI0029CB8A63|nr:MGMT family protein [Actinocorallia sp. A-T 12471]MDX6738818.1 MGMT family protein [Actinocorallia sp. A-T 12471]